MPKNPALFFFFFFLLLFLTSTKTNLRKKKNYFNYIFWNGGMFSASLNVHILHILSKNKKNYNSKCVFGFTFMGVYVFTFHFFFLFFLRVSRIQLSLFTHCNSTAYALFMRSTVTLFRKKILKINLTVLFTHLKIILLQCF